MLSDVSTVTTQIQSFGLEWAKCTVVFQKSIPGFLAKPRKFNFMDGTKWCKMISE